MYFIQEWKQNPSIHLMPVVENCDDKKQQFLCKYPPIDFKQESIVPVIIGMASSEGGYLAASKYFFI